MMDEFKLNLTLIGNQGVGKTSITNVFVKDTFNNNEQSTLGTGFQNKTVIYDNMEITFKIWDTSGQQKYIPLLPLYLREAQVIFIVFDVADLKSFDRLEEWINMVREIGQEKRITIVGNKSDLQEYSLVGQEQLRDFAYKFDCDFQMVSAKANIGIQDLFIKTAILVRKQGVDRKDD